MLKRSIYLILVFLLGCIDPVSFKFEGQQEHLVVEAKFTSLAEINYIKLSESQSYNSPYNVFVRDALIYVTDEETGYTYTFFHSEDGIYLPANPQDNPLEGHTYVLHITRGENDQSYESYPITMAHSVPIDSVYPTYDEHYLGVDGEKEVRLQAGYQLSVDFQDPVSEDNYYRWSYVMDYEVETQPEKHLLFGCVNCPIPDPLPCCAQCWINEMRDDFKVSSDRLTDGQKVLNQEIIFLPFERYLNQRMKLRVFQHSITETANNFFEAIELQQNSEGGIFDPPPAELKGNMFNPENPDEQVIGIFEVSAVSEYEYVVDGEDIPYPMQFFQLLDDCRVMENSTTQMPEGWYQD